MSSADAGGAALGPESLQLAPPALLLGITVHDAASTSVHGHTLPKAHVQLLPPLLPPPPGAGLTPMQQLFQDDRPDVSDDDEEFDGGSGGTTGGDIEAPTKPTDAAHAERLAREAERAAERYKDTQEEDDETELSLGMKILGAASAVLAIMICVGGSVILSWNDAALTAGKQCDQLYVWGLLFCVFEGLYLVGLTMHACFSDESFHTRRVKTLILLVIFSMSVLFWTWGTVMINTSRCPEAEFRDLWLYFRVLYWFIVGVWSLVLLILTAPLVLFILVKAWMNRVD